MARWNILFYHNQVFALFALFDDLKNARCELFALFAMFRHLNFKGIHEIDLFSLFNFIVTKKTVFFLINFYGSIRPSNHSVRYPPCEAVPILYAWTRSNCKSCAKICAKIYGKTISRKYYTYQVPAIDFDNTNDTQMKAGRLRAMNQSKYFLIWIKMYFIRIKFDTTQFP